MPPPRAAWGRMGATSFATCSTYDRAAASVFPAAAAPDSSVRWVERARVCGRAPNVLLMAARELAVARVGVELTKMPPPAREAHAAARAKDLAQARRLVETARVEARRLGAMLPPGATYLRAYLALAAGDVPRAARLGAQALRRGDVPAYRALRMLAAVALLQENLERAVVLCEAAIEAGEVDAGATRGITQALAAWIYDRAGDGAAAARAFSAAGVGSNPSTILSAAAMLPFHERLFLLGLYQAHVGNRALARKLFEAYLARPDPGPPERAHARRHLAALEAARRPAP